MSALHQLSANSPQSSAKKAESRKLTSESLKKGFTLVELMAVISLVAIVSAVGLVSYSQTQKIGRDARRKQELRQIAVALELFYQKNKKYPCSGTGTTWQSSNEAGWLTDSNAVNCGGSTLNIAPQYINKMPTDPLSNNGVPNGATGYGYAYYSVDSQYNASCPKGQYYILITKLENSGDKERLGTAGMSFCGTTLSTSSTPSFNENQFIITGP